MKSMLTTAVVCGMFLAPTALAATPAHPGLGGGGTGLPPTASTYVPVTLPATPSPPTTPSQAAIPTQTTTHASATNHPDSSTKPTLPTTSSSTHGKPSVLPAPRCASGAAHAKQITYLLRGTLSAFTAATATKAGSITIAVSGGNCFTRTLAGTSVTFTLDQATRVVNANAISDGDRGIIQLRGTKTLDTSTLKTIAPRLVIDQAAKQPTD